MAKAKNPVQAVDRTLRILEVIQENNGATVSEIADEVEIGMSAVHNHLSTLADRGYVVKNDRTYDIGLSFLGLGAYARNQTDIYGIARPEIDRLAEETGELASLLIMRGGMGVYLYQREGENAVELDTHLGKRVHLHCTGLGKALLGFLPEEEVHEILDQQGMPRMTVNTITNRDELFAELEQIRERSYAIDQEERLNGLRCLAAPITDGEDRAIAAISVSCPIHRVSDDWFFDELSDKVLGAANVIEIKRNYS